MSRVSTHRRHPHIRYAQSLPQRLYTLVLAPSIALVLTVLFFSIFSAQTHEAAPTLSLTLLAVFATFARLFVAYFLALACAIPLALLVTHNAIAERIFLPLFDIMQSLPVLAFFPVIILFFVHWGLYNTAAVFVLFLAMLWNIVFSLVGGLHAIPQEILSAGRVFGLRGLAYVEKILLPASVPYLVTGSLLAWAQGWNIVIVAEVLHTYLPGNDPHADLFGIGSLLVEASSSGAAHAFLLGIATMVSVIALLNLFVWQKLLHFAERFKFE